MNGDLDGLIMTEGIALALQNLTWNGGRGFNKAPTAPVYDTMGARSGTYTRERGLTFAIIPKSGHMVSSNRPCRVKLYISLTLFISQDSWRHSFTGSSGPQNSGWSE
jgi:carboxypeptidase C (cathepsin A)